MLFNSFQFMAFFTIVYFLYLLLRHKWQNRMLLIASFVFYGAWDWRFLFLMVIAIIVDYVCAIKIAEADSERTKKWFLSLSIIVTFGILGFFKYFNFFIGTFHHLIAQMGLNLSFMTLNIILPVGISFYTFQAMSYTIDVYRGKISPAKNLLDFALFVSFFPQLVAGPIERASHLLPQVLSPRVVNMDKFREGCYLFFWGLFQKIFVADNLAKIVESVFSKQSSYSGAEVLLALYAFAFQIYCDFAGYSDMARGLGKSMGFDIMINFNLPYFATNPKEFWRRWHISLSSWLKDYLYVPLGGNQNGQFKTYRNLVITMLLGGLWHGAAWTFVVWGAYHGLLLVIHRLIEPVIQLMPKIQSLLWRRVWFGIRVIFFFHLVCLGWLIFRAESMSQAYSMILSIFTNFSLSELDPRWGSVFILTTWFLILVDFFRYKLKDINLLFHLRPVLRLNLWMYIICSMVLMGALTEQQFIYFQF